MELEAILTSDGSAQWWYSPDAPRAAIQAVRSRWDDTGGDLKHYESLFKVARNTQQAATLLRIREEDVPAILHFLGLELARDEYWRPSNKPERRELAELAAADAGGHWSLRVDSLREGLAEILALPPGQRRKQAEGILRRQAFEAAEQQEAKDEPYVAKSESGRDDQFEVMKFDDGYDRIVVGTIQLLPDGTCAVIDPDGRIVLNSSGSEVRLSGIDDAAEFISGRYKKR